MRCGVGNVLIRLNIERKELDAAGKFARLQVLKGSIAFLGGASREEDVVGAAGEQLVGNFEPDAAICCTISAGCPTVEKVVGTYHQLPERSPSQYLPC